MSSTGKDAQRRRLEAIAFARPAGDLAGRSAQADARRRLEELDAPVPPEPERIAPAAVPRSRVPRAVIAVAAAFALGVGAVLVLPPPAPPAPLASTTAVADPLDAVFATVVSNWSRIENPSAAQAAIAAQAPVYVNPLPDSDGFQVALALTGSEEVCVIVTYPDSTVAGSCVTGDEFTVAGVSIDSTGMRSRPYPATSMVETQRLQPAQRSLTRVNVQPSGSITETVTPLG